MAIEYYDSVWDAIEDTPEEALNMRLRSELMARIAGRVREWDITQKENITGALFIKTCRHISTSFGTWNTC